MSTALTLDSSVFRNRKPQIFAGLALAKDGDTEDFATAIPVSAGSGAPSHAGVIGELYVRTDSSATIPALYRATTTAIWEPVGGYQAAVTAASSAVTNTAVETDFDQTIVLPANLLTQGSKVRIRCQGIATATHTNDTLAIKVYLDGTAIVSIPGVDVANNDIFYVDFELTVRGALGASAAVVGCGVGGTGTPGTLTAKPTILASTNFATNGALTVKASATWSAADVGNSCRMDVLSVEVI